MTVAAAPTPAREREALTAPAYRLQLVGLVVVITVVAIEAMSVATIMPTVARALHGLRFYGWGFTAYLLADVVGMVDAGRRCDRHGPTRSLVGGLTGFAIGLVVASAAPDMAVFLAGRVLQGFGGGAMIVAAYVVVARAFPDSLHPRVFGVLSAAWVVPALVGPALAGLVASTLSWRWVFAGIAPFAIAGALLLVPVLRALPAQPPGRSESAYGIGRGVLLATGLGLVQLAAERADWWSAPLAAAGLVLGLTTLRRLLPAGTLRLARGLPSVVALRGVLACGFFGAEAYLPLTLTRLHHGSPRVVGIPLTVAAVGWAAGSWWQGRRPERPTRLLRCGFAAVAVGVGLLMIITSATVSLWLAVPFWTIAGTGMGLAMPTISVRLLELSSPEEQGRNTAALQICDMVGSVIGIAFASVLVTGFGLADLRAAMLVANGAFAAVAILGVAASSRASTPA